MNSELGDFYETKRMFTFALLVNILEIKVQFSLNNSCDT